MNITHGVKLGCLYKKNTLRSLKRRYLSRLLPFAGG